MALVAKLENPTPWDVVLPWERGVNIRISAFGSKTLTMQQMDDFRDNKPGSEAVHETLDYHGLFLRDSDRPYDNQAIEALQRSRDKKKAQYTSAVQNITDRRAAAGVAPNAEALQETLKFQGLETLNNKVITLNDQIKKLDSILGSQKKRNMHQQLDPARTVFVVEPPREFPSVAAMNFFLDQNPEIQVRHEGFSQRAIQTEEPETLAPKAATSATGAE